MCFFVVLFCFFQAEDGIRDLVRSRGLGDVYKRQAGELSGVDKERRGAEGLPAAVPAVAPASVQRAAGRSGSCGDPGDAETDGNLSLIHI